MWKEVRRSASATLRAASAGLALTTELGVRVLRGTTRRVNIPYVRARRPEKMA